MWHVGKRIPNTEHVHQARMLCLYSNMGWMVGFACLACLWLCCMNAHNVCGGTIDIANNNKNIPKAKRYYYIIRTHTHVLCVQLCVCGAFERVIREWFDCVRMWAYVNGRIYLQIGEMCGVCGKIYRNYITKWLHRTAERTFRWTSVAATASTLLPSIIT